MNSRALVVGLIAVIVFGAFLFKGKGKEDTAVQEVQNQASARDEETIATLDGQIKSMGAVEVEVTPVNVEPGSNMAFDVSFNTHSVELSYDYTTIVSAEDDGGSVYKALSWSGGEGGHHLNGQVELQPISREAKVVTLIIDGIDNEKAVFEWNL